MVSSDLRRARDLLVAAAACAASVAAVALASHREGVSPGALSRPHERAKLECASCHAKEDPRASCTTCHDATSHQSTRPGHMKMRAQGALGCTDCHRAHGEGETITLEASGAYVRSGGGAEVTGALVHGGPAATIPLVPLSVCARCHDTSSRTDPIALCSTGSGDLSHRAVTCMDEHKHAGDTHRFAAWSEASEIARTTPWVERAREQPAPWGFAFAGLLSVGAALTLRRRRSAPASAATPVAPPRKKRLPVIDASTCLGCHACVEACPFDVIEVEKFVAVVARPDDCCGVVLCQQACPNGSLRIAEADAEQPALVDDKLEAVDVPGLYLAGDLTGLPLIKNALRQGASAIDRIHETLPKKNRGEDLDVIIIGAGPAGLAASLRAKELGLRYATLEQASIAASIRAFPRHKLVYDQPLHVPGEGELWMKECTKEELLAQWTRVVRKHALAIREEHRVVDVAREENGFVVRAEHAGADVVLHAKHVIVAIGRRGSPRMLPIDIAPRAESKVFYHLADARSLAGQRVFVVGLGDAAMEAAIALASQPGTRVTVCHRGEGFSRGKTRNVAEMKALVARKKIDLRLSTELVAIGESVTIRSSGETATLPADAIFVLIGGVPSWDLLARAGLKILSRDDA